MNEQSRAAIGDVTSGLPAFEPPASDLLAVARLLLSRRARLEKLAFREFFEVPALAEHGFTTGADARAALARLTEVAGALLLEAAAQTPARGEALAELGRVYLARREPEAALECFARAAGLQVGGASTRREHVKALLLLGRHAEAIDAWSAATGIERGDLVATRLLPFEAWVRETGGRLRQLHTPQGCEVALDCRIAGRDIGVVHRVQETPLLAAEFEDLRIDGIVPQKDGAGYFYPQGLVGLEERVQVLAETGFIRRSMPDAEVIDRPCIYLGGVGWHYQNYYHFVVQNVARLTLMLADEAYRNHCIAVPTLIRPWGRQFLEELGIGADRLVVLPAARSSLLRSAVVPNMRGVPSSAEMDGLRSALAVDRTRTATRRIWVGRRGSPAHTRLLLNEDEIVGIAREFGFEELDPGTMSIREQIELFNDAAAICGPNGAAFTNALYAPDGARVICLSPRETIGTWYPDIAGMCGHSYFWCFGSFLEETRGSSLVPQMPYSIPAEDFRAILERAVPPPPGETAEAATDQIPIAPSP